MFEYDDPCAAAWMYEWKWLKEALGVAGARTLTRDCERAEMSTQALASCGRFRVVGTMVLDDEAGEGDGRTRTPLGIAPTDVFFPASFFVREDLDLDALALFSSRAPNSQLLSFSSCVNPAHASDSPPFVEAG